MRFETALHRVAVAALVLALAPLPGRAADLGPMFAPPMEEADQARTFQFGMGWYLRGDVAAGSEDRPTLVVANELARFKSGSGTGYGFGLGGGYKFTSFLRADVTADYLEPLDYKASVGCGANCSQLSKTTLSRWDALANGYADLGTWFGLTPYVGAGVGVAGVEQDASLTFTGDGSSQGKQSLPSRSDARFAWAAMAGFSYALDPHLLMDVGYRYLDLGRTTIRLTPLASTRQEITDQQVRVGLRYMVD